MPPLDPVTLFQSWLAEARRTELNDPNAMTLATATPTGRPSARIVLLKGADSDGFVFYTNTRSRKGDELTQNPQAALLFHWKSSGRQVRVEGLVQAVDAAEADLYFNSRARVSRLGAWASEQSRPLPDRAELESRLQTMERTYPGRSIPRPPHWSGYRVWPESIEFWQEAPFRLHDRTVFKRNAGGWAVNKLYP